MKSELQSLEREGELSGDQWSREVKKLPRLQTGDVPKHGDDLKAEATAGIATEVDRAAEARKRIEAISRPEFTYPDVTVVSEAATPVKPSVKRFKSTHSRRTKIVAGLTMMVGTVVGWAKGTASDDAEAAVRPPVATAEGFKTTPTELASDTAQQPDKLASAAQSAETAISTEVVRKNRNLSLAEKQELTRVSGIGLNELNIRETGEFNSRFGKVTIAGIDGAKPFIPEAEIVRQVTLYDQLAAEERTYTTTITPAGGAPVAINYKVVPAERPRIVIFANQDQSLAYPIFPDPKVENPTAFTDVALHKKGMIEVVMMREPVNRGLAVHSVGTELGHSAGVVVIEPAERQRLINMPGVLGRLTDPKLPVDHQIDVVEVMLQEGYGGGLGLVAGSESWPIYERRQVNNSVLLFDSVHVPYQKFDKAVYESVQKTLEK